MESSYSENVNDNEVEQCMNAIQLTLSILKNRPLKYLSIYKVPNQLRRLKEEAYNPRHVSIGPFHASNQKLEAKMEVPKLRYMQDFLNRIALLGTNGGNQEQVSAEALKRCVKAILGWTDVARACYGENIDLENRELVYRLLVDGCFILELFIKHAEKYQNQNNLLDPRWRALAFYQMQISHQNPDKEEKKLDPINNSLGMVPALQHDLVLLENQIPFEVLVKLFRIIRVVTNNQFEFSLERYVLLFFRSALNLSDQAIEYACTRKCTSPSTYKHISGFLHRVYQPESETRSTEILEGQEKIEWGFKRCATQLVESGIQFQRGDNEECRLLDIKFDPRRGVITIPPLDIQEITDSVFRNLIAFEQCNVGCSPHMASYAWLMKTLIRSSQDAKLLRLKGIITTNKVGGDEEVSTFFQSLCREVVFKDFCFSVVCEEVNEYDKSCLNWGRIKAAVKVRSVADPSLGQGGHLTPLDFQRARGAKLKKIN